MTDAPKPRRFRYSLRTLFVMVTLVACWLGYQLNWIQQRRAFTTTPERNVLSRGPGKTPSAPWPLWLFGEQGYDVAAIRIVSEDGARWAEMNWEVNLQDSPELSYEQFLTPADHERLDRARRLFPEAIARPSFFRPKPTPATHN